MNSIRLLCVRVLPLLSLAPALWPSPARGQGETVSEPGLFSYQAPKGWIVKSTPFSKFKMSFDAMKNKFAANINVVAEISPASFQNYVKAGEAALEASPLLHHLELIDREDFKTAAGLDGARLSVTDVLGATHLRQTLYFFQGPAETKFVVTATCLASEGDTYAPIFDASMKSFSLQ